MRRRGAQGPRGEEMGLLCLWKRLAMAERGVVVRGGGGRLNCLQRQRTLLLVCDPLHTNTRTHILHPNSLRHPSNHPSPPRSLQAGWTLTSMAATFLQIEKAGRGARVMHIFFFVCCMSCFLLW